MARKRAPNQKQFVLNCVPSTEIETDWSYRDAIEAGVVSDAAPPSSKDLRTKDWNVRNQQKTGACVGFAAADGVLRWHYVQAGLIGKSELPSPRFIWMANKETDEITSYPTSFIETAGTQTKLALAVARRYGCVLESDLPMSGSLSALSTAAFYTRAARLRIATYHNLGRDLDAWRTWIANNGPVLTRLDVDKTWYQATANNGILDAYRPLARPGGHAVCLVGYTSDHFVVRNSWGEGWGDKGFAYATSDYAQRAFTEAYGCVL